MNTFIMKTAAVWILIASTSLTAIADSVDEQIEKMEQQRYTDIINGNWESLASLLAEEFFYNQASGKSVSKDAYIESLRTGAQKVQRALREDSTIHKYGDVVIVTGITDVDGSLSGDKVLQFRYLHVWHKKHGEWKLVARQTTYMIPRKWDITGLEDSLQLNTVILSVRRPSTD